MASSSGPGARRAKAALPRQPIAGRAVRFEGSGLAEWLVREGTVDAQAMPMALARQVIYGGTLDTALLELGFLDEVSLWARLVAVTGLPAPDPRLCTAPHSEVAVEIPASDSAQMQVVPVAKSGRKLKLLCTETANGDSVRAAMARRGFEARLYVVPEIRYLAARRMVYGEALPSRYAPLWARVGRTRPASLVARTPAAGVDLRGKSGTPLEHVLDLSGAVPMGPALEGDLEAGERPATSMRAEAFVVPAFEAIAEGVVANSGENRAPARNNDGSSDATPEDTGAATDSAIEALAELRDPLAVPLLIERLGDAEPSSSRAHAALRALAVADFGRSQHRWRRWWRKHAAAHRTEWLLDALSHPDIRLRRSAFEELRELAQESFGYAPELRRREARAAVAKWRRWWETRAGRE